MQANIENILLFQIEKTSKDSKLYSQREFDRLGMGITVEQWILLKIVQENDGLNQKELSEKSLRDPASITRTLDILCKNGYVERMPVANNRRQYSICISKNGRNFIEKYMPEINNHRAKSIEGLTKNEIDTLMKLLSIVQKNMKLI